MVFKSAVHPPRRALLAFALGLSLTALGLRGRATTLNFRSLDELVAMADLVVIAVPRTSFAHWLGGYIVTDHRVEVLSVVRGSLPAWGFTVTVRCPGGVVGSVGQSLEGAPTLEQGRATVMLLTPERSGAREVLNLSAGLLPIQTSPHAPPRVMPARTEDIHFVGQSNTEGSLSVPPSGVPLEEFVTRLRAFRP